MCDVVTGGSIRLHSAVSDGVLLTSGRNNSGIKTKFLIQFPVTNGNTFSIHISNVKFRVYSFFLNDLFKHYLNISPQLKY